jgi:hypothetical protein
MLGEEHKLRVSGDRVVREIFVPERHDVTLDCRRLHSEELHDQYC